MPKKKQTVYKQVQIERFQSHATRVQLFRELERLLGRPVVSLCTSFVFPIMIEDDDAEMLEAVIRNLDLSKGLVLFISSPGGDGEAAERIIRICRSHSGTGEYWALVPGKAKSAATVLCFGASKILMGPSSELGPVDPQIIFAEDGRRRQHSAYNLVTSYDHLFKGAVRTKGHIEPFIDQLQHYDPREIQRCRELIELAEDIAVKALKTGMMRRRRLADIRRKIERFLKPPRTKSHGRPIFREEADECDLRIQAVDAKSAMWGVAHELYIRSNEYVSHGAAKCVESSSDAFYAASPPLCPLKGSL